MASSATKDTLIVLKKRLERAQDEKTMLHIIHKLSKFPITLDLLQGTGAGKVMRSLAKKSGEVGIKASVVLNRWREVVAESQKSNEHTKKSKHDSYSKESSGIHKQSTKYVKEKHDKVKHSKEKLSLKSDHNGHMDYEMNEKFEKDKKKYSKETIKYKNSNHSIEESSKYASYLGKTESNGSMDDAYNPEFPEIMLPERNSPKHTSKKINGMKDCLYEPSAKKPKLSKSCSSEYESVHTPRKQICDSDTFQSDSASVKHVRDNLHVKKAQKSSKVHAEKSTILAEKPHKVSEHSKKIKKNKDGGELRTKKATKKLAIQNAEEFTASEALFEDCLSFNDIIPINKRKSSGSKKTKTFKSDNVHKLKNTSEISPKPSVASNKIHAANKSNELRQMHSAKHQERDIVSKTLPQPLPNYRPLPQRSYEAVSPTKKKVMSNEEAIKFTSSRREKTAVYSGRKNHYLTEVPSLFECCTRVLIENIDDIEYMGVIPFFLLESMLKRCTPAQLYRLENFNPYLLEDTAELWEVHCRREFRCSKRQENETWRELYIRSHEEQEEKLKSVTANITASIANSNPVRKAKLAYIDAVVKPPREVARKQAKNGTALTTNHSAKAIPPTKNSSKPVPTVKIASTSRGPTEYKPTKPKVAPLMAKTLKSMKQCFRR